MNNASAHALLGTKHRTKSNKTKSTTQRIKKINNTTPTEISVIPDAREWSVVPLSYKTPVVLLIFKPVVKLLLVIKNGKNIYICT